MKPTTGKLIPALLCAAVIAVVAALQWMVQRADTLPFLQRLEWMTYDWRIREAVKHPSQVATNLGFVSITDDTIDELATGRLGVEASLYWPRYVYGLLVQELDHLGAEAVAFDVLFIGERSTNEMARLPDGTPGGKIITDDDGRPLTSDHWFALQLQAGNVILGAQTNAYPPDRFRSPVWPLGDIAAIKDDGTLRRAKAFEDYVMWHQLIKEAVRRRDGFVFDTNGLIFPTDDGRLIQIPIDADRNFNQATLFEALMAHLNDPRKAPANINPIAKAFTRRRVWNLGLTLAALHLKLNLAEAQIEPGRRILLRGPTGVQRSIPIDQKGRFYIDWGITNGSRLIATESFDSLLAQRKDREAGKTNRIENRFRDKLVLVGSIAAGNDLTDFGATPLEANTFLTTGLWNVSNSLLTGRFVRQSALSLNLCLIALFGLAAARVTWKSRTLAASLTVALLGIAYTGLALYIYVHSRYWLPLVLPLAALIFTHFALLTYRVVFEQKERRRIRNVFARIVSPNVVTELLKAEKLSVSGARREVTVFFSDIRGFTEMTDEGHARAEAHVLAQKLSGVDAEAYFDEQAAEVLATVNRFLSAIADKVKEHEGTLDKYIGDCVMAFWGAPTPNPRHAVSCVRAAIDAQRAIATLNEERAAENQRRERENAQRATQRIDPLPLLKPLHMGSGINTGIVTIGLMGSEQHISNYTVFGREVNLASRLEGLSGRGRIVISEATFAALQRDEPELAAACRELPAATVKGFRTAVKVYEVPWKLIAGSLAFEAAHATTDAAAKMTGSPAVP